MRVGMQKEENGCLPDQGIVFSLIEAFVWFPELLEPGRVGQSTFKQGTIL